MMPEKSGQRPGRWHVFPIRVRYQETDQMGVVYHANYVNWFEIGRTELIRQRGMTYREIEAKGLLLPVAELESKFYAPARYDDLVLIYTRIAAYTAATIRFESEIRRSPGANDATADGSGDDCRGTESIALLPDPEPAGELLVRGATRHIWLNKEWKPVRIDKEAPELFRLLGEE
jgi:acyl-CoA thioester hydrolase